MIDEAGIAVTSREPRYLAGFTAIGIIVLAAIAYSIRISIDHTTGSNLLTATFLLTNIAGWLLGSMLRRKSRSSVLGLLLVLLGDAIFPLNLFAPFILFTPGLRGRVAFAATAVVLVGIGYHLWNYRRRSVVRFALPFYPYFFAFAGCVAIILMQFTTGLTMGSIAWLVLVYAVAFNEVSYRLRPEPALHFATAGAAILTSSAVVSAIAFRGRGEAALAAIAVSTILMIISAIRERNDEAMARAHGFAAWLGLTITFTALLYYVHSPLWVYIVATGAWTMVLGAISVLPAFGWTEPFLESAWWTEILLAMALAGTLWQYWLPFIIRTMAARPLHRATSLGLLEAGIALLAVSTWRRRNPRIASTLRGFVTNNVLLRLTTYAAPLLLILAVTGGWSVIHAPEPANVYALLAAGMLLLIISPFLAGRYPPEALDFAGVLAMVFSAFNGLASVALSAGVLFAAAAIFLIRYLRGAATWTFAAFLTLTVAGLALQPIGTPVSTIVFLIAAGVIAVASNHAPAVLARIGYWTAHAAALVFWLSLARTLGLGHNYDALLLAAWTWFAYAGWKVSRERAAQTSLQVCLALATASLILMLVQPTGILVVLASLLVIAALLLELPNLHYAGFALLAVAVGLSANRGDGRWLAAVLLVSAVILLSRSLSRGSSFAHLLFVTAAASAAYLLMPARGPLQTLPLAILVAILLLVELAASKVQAASSFHADLTSVISLLLAVGILIAEVVNGRFSVYVLLVLFLSMVAIRPWITSWPAYRLQPAMHAAFRALGAVLGAVLVVAAARLAGLSSGQQIFAAALSTVLVLAWLLLTRRGTTTSLSISVALHILALGVFVSALIVRGSDPFLILACLVTGVMYLLWRAAWKVTALEHLAAVGVVEAVWLWGIANHIAWLELYLFSASAYLCIVLLRGIAPRLQNALAIVVITASVAYPYYALLRTTQKEHLAFLGAASIVVIHVLLTTRRHALMVLTVCAMLGFGMVFGAVTLHDDARLNLLMALVGFLVFADLGLIGFRTDRRPVVGELEYDRNPVAR